MKLKNLFGIIFIISSFLIFSSAVFAATTRYVSTTGTDSPDCSVSASPCQTITYAIGQSISGDTINVAAGTYDEQVVIDKNLTLQGAGDTTIIKPSSAAKLTITYTLGTQTGALWNGKKLASIISVSNAGNVIIKDLKVDGESVTSLPAGADYVVGVSYGETGGTISNVKVVNMNKIPESIRTYGMWLDAVSNSVSVEVKSSNIELYNKNGINSRGATLTINIHDNSVTGPDTASTQYPNGIGIVSGAMGTAAKNVITYIQTPGEDYTATGIFTYDTSGVTIEDNTISEALTGIALSGTPSTGGTGNSFVERNTIFNCDVGIQLETPNTVNNKITGNTIYDNDLAFYLNGINGDGVQYSMGAGNEANYNKIYSNLQGIENTNPDVMFNAEKNWWGSSTGPTHSSNPEGTGDSISDNVDYSPWLGAVPETTPMTWYTNDKIQDAINAANSGDTINVLAGTYVEDLTIPSSKTSLNLVGSPATIKGVSNVDASLAPLAVPNIEILANGVKLHDFTIEGPNYQAGRYSSGMIIGASNVRIYSNTFKVTPAANGDEISQAIQTYHKLAKPGVDISDLNIFSNTFTDLSSSVAGYEAIWINLDEGSGTVTVQNNKFTGDVMRAVTTERSKTLIKGNEIITDLSPNAAGSGGWQGINIGGANSGSISTISVFNNVIKGSSSGKGFKSGIKLGYAVSSTFSDVEIAKNNIQMNDIGIWLKYTASGIVVNYNNIYGNTVGIENDDATNTLNAKSNWWGAASGPKDISGTTEVPPCTADPTTEKNSDGTGNEVSDRVAYCPWLNSLINFKDRVKPEVVTFSTSDPSPIKAGTVDFTVTFNEDMNIFVEPDARLKGSSIKVPSKTGAVLINGWQDTKTWIGQLVITNTVPGDGEYDFQILDAEDIAGNKMNVFKQKDLIIDTKPPQLVKTLASDIFGSQDLTLVASAFDPDSSGISKVQVKIDGGALKDMTFSFAERQKIANKRVNVSTYFLIIDGDSLISGIHSAVFKAIDNAGNEFVSSAVTFEKKAAGTTGGDIAFLCNDGPVLVGSDYICREGIEMQTIEWLRSKGWDVEVKKYDQWTREELNSKDLIVCSDQSKACRPTQAVSDAHKLDTIPFVEISDSGSARAAYDFGYVKNPYSSKGRATQNIFVETPDPITTGFFGSTEILTSAQRIPSIPQSKLLSVTDLGSRDDSPANSNWFKTGSSIRYAFVGWFYGTTSGKTFKFNGWDPTYLNPDGEELLKRTLYWAQCENPTGCI